MIYVIIAIGLVVHQALLFCLLASLPLLFAGRQRVDTIAVLLVFVTVSPNVYFFLQVGALYLTELPVVILMTLMALIACYIRPGAGSSGQFSREGALVLVLVACFGFGAARDGTFTSIQRTLLSITLELGLPYFLFSRFCRSRADFEILVGVLAGCAVLLAVMAIIEVRTRWAIYDVIYSNQSAFSYLSRSLHMRAGFLRAPVSFSDSTAFALFQVMGILAIATSRRFFRSDLLWLGSIAIAGLGLLAAQSRGADIALLVGWFAMLLARRRYALAGLVAAGGGALVAALIALASFVPVIAAALGMDQRAGGDQDYRQTLLRRGLQVGMEHPVLGDGMTRVLAKMADITQGEGLVDLVNTYLNIFLNSGAVGLALVVICIAAVTISLFRWRGVQMTSDLQVFLAGALSSIVVGLAFTSFDNDRNSYWLMMILAGIRVLRFAPANEGAMQPLANANGLGTPPLVEDYLRTAGGAVIPPNAALRANFAGFG